MNKPYSKKLIASTLAFTILLGGGLAYGAASRVLADDTGSTSQQQTAAKDRQTKLQELKAKFANRQKGYRKGDQFPILEEAAQILGMDKDALSKALQEKSLADIAKDKGMSSDDLVAKLQAQRNQKIDEAVAAGKIPADKAEKLKAGMSKHLAFMVNKKGLHELGKNRGIKQHPMMKESLDKVAGILGMTKDELSAELKAGKSLTEIAASKGISKQDLVAKIKEQMTPMIEKMVDRKHEAKTKEPAAK